MPAALTNDLDPGTPGVRYQATVHVEAEELPERLAAEGVQIDELTRLPGWGPQS